MLFSLAYRCYFCSAFIPAVHQILVCNSFLSMRRDFGCVLSNRDVQYSTHKQLSDRADKDMAIQSNIYSISIQYFLLDLKKFCEKHDNKELFAVILATELFLFLL